jgi:serine/threonine protein kinase
VNENMDFGDKGEVLLFGAKVSVLYINSIIDFITLKSWDENKDGRLDDLRNLFLENNKETKKNDIKIGQLINLNDFTRYLYKIIDEENDLYEFKLCDFGLVKEKLSKNDIENSVSGTINYMEDDKKNYYEKGFRVYDKELSEIYDLGNVMHYLFFGEEYNKNNKNFVERIYNIKDEDFQYILKNTLTHDIQKIHVDEYFKANFFKKDRKDLIDGINNDKIFTLIEEDAIEIVENITKIKNPKFLDYTNNITIEKLSKDVEHFTSYIENDTFNFVCYNKKENQIEIYEENKEKYSKKEEKK